MDTQQVDIGNNLIRTCLQGARTLVVSFDTGGIMQRLDAKRDGFGQKFLLEAGYDVLFIMPKVLDWYQSAELVPFFKSLGKSGFFADYDRIICYGSSMGGFGAIAYSSLVNASDIIAFQPRTTLRDNQARWQSPYSKVMDINRRGVLADAIIGLHQPATLTIFYDPFYSRDARHAKRVLSKSPKARLLKVPFIGHFVPEYFSRADILKTIFNMALMQRFDTKGYYSLIRQRKVDKRYHDSQTKYLAARQKRGQKT